MSYEYAMEIFYDDDKINEETRKMKYKIAPLNDLKTVEKQFESSFSELFPKIKINLNELINNSYLERYLKDQYIKVNKINVKGLIVDNVVSFPDFSEILSLQIKVLELLKLKETLEKDKAFTVKLEKYELSETYLNGICAQNTYHTKNLKQSEIFDGIQSIVYGFNRLNSMNQQLNMHIIPMFMRRFVDIYYDKDGSKSVLKFRITKGILNYINKF